MFLSYNHRTTRSNPTVNKDISFSLLTEKIRNISEVHLPTSLTCLVRSSPYHYSTYLNLLGKSLSSMFFIGRIAINRKTLVKIFHQRLVMNID